MMLTATFLRIDRQRRTNYESRPPRQRQDSERSQGMRTGMRIGIHLVSREFPVSYSSIPL